MKHIVSSMCINYKPSEENGDDPSTKLGDLQESGLGEIEVLARRIAPAAVVARQSEVRRAEVGGGDGDNACAAPLRVIVAPQLVTRAAAQSAVE